jgi:hypothetical protein
MLRRSFGAPAAEAELRRYRYVDRRVTAQASHWEERAKRRAALSQKDFDQ